MKKGERIPHDTSIQFAVRLPYGGRLMCATPTRIVIADCQPAVIAGVAYELRREPDIEIVGTTRSRGGLAEALERGDCDVIISDLMPLPDSGDHCAGITMLASLQSQHPDIGLVIFTMIDNPGVISSLLAQRISCVFSKRDDLDKMPEAIRVARARGGYLSPAIASIIRRNETDGASSGDFQALTPRELEVTRLFVSGMTINEIAARLNRRKQTVSAQKHNAMRKLGIGRDVDLIRYAIDMRLF
ncbi:response regulator transcription factor [Burkholderia pyrrocinia]|uniref:response regulator transcription factor n=1 Tax=Burkholderia pyrrocinia TaxID=60550 RepID=UPI001FC7FA32|nr:response regulator transcription factor [Burkholderia pyrrocinia]